MVKLGGSLPWHHGPRIAQPGALTISISLELMAKRSCLTINTYLLCLFFLNWKRCVFFKWKNLLVAYFKGNGLYLVYTCYKLTPPWLTELEKTIEMVFLLFLEPEESTENGFHKIEDDAEIWDLIKSSYTFNISWRELLGGEQLQFVTS